jgi:AcrR family transcriptional regulator
VTADRTTRAPRRARGSISAGEILDVTERLIAESGVSSLTMAQVAKRIGASGTSVYWYFPTKDDLLLAVAARAGRQLSGWFPPVGQGSWDEEFIAYFVAYRQLVERTPVLRQLLAFRTRFLFTRSVVADVMSRRTEAGLELLVGAGLTPQVARAAFLACADLTHAFVILSQANPRPTTDGLPAPARVIDLDDAAYRRALELLVAGVCADHGLSRGTRTTRGAYAVAPAVPS